MSEKPILSQRKRAEELLFVKIPYVISGILFLIATAINITNVVARYVFLKPIFWAEEVLVFLMVWGVFVVAITITYRGAHLGMDLIYKTFNPRMKLFINIAVTVLFLACTIFTAAQSWQVVLLHYRNHGVTAGTDIPLIIPHTAVLFGFSIMAVTVFVRLRSYITGKFD
jgi:TRAP-type C4-dicarboxylate transport system permease small subunit